MNYEEMELDELKEYAKSKGITFGKIGKEKLIERIKAKEEGTPFIIDTSELDDVEPDSEEEDVTPINTAEKKDNASLLDQISSVIDDLDDSQVDEVEEVEDLPMDTVIPVKSITYGGLIYKSRSTNAVFRWPQIGAIEYMTVSQLTEMNNYKNDFLRKPLVILMDDRAIKKFRLTQIYENVAKINNLSDVFKSDLKTISRTIDTALDVNMRDILISKVRQMYKNHKLVDINVIRLLEDKLQFDLSEAD